MRIDMSVCCLACHSEFFLASSLGLGTRSVRGDVLLKWIEEAFGSILEASIFLLDYEVDG